jgi:radical SAM-linked protein
VERALKNSGQDQVSLTALSTADVSCISPLIKNLVERTAPERVSLSIASLRAYGLADDLLDDMRRVRASGLTFAPEAGTQRMRDVINKNVTEEQLLETAERVFARGFDKMKLYFMIGLPTETDDDVRGIIDVGKNAFRVGQRLRRGRATVIVSVSTHVPKPHTPFQWCAMDTQAEIRRKQQLLKESVSSARGVTLRTHHSVTSVLEGVLSRGDRALSKVIERAYHSGARFDSWDECLNLPAWEEAFLHYGVDRSRYLGTIPVSARLPWDHLDLGLEDGFLLREYRKALDSRLSPPCGKVKGMFIHHATSEEALGDERKLVCYDCGIACDMTSMRDTRITFLTQLDEFKAKNPVRLPLLPPEAPSNTKHVSPEALRPIRSGSTPERFRLRFQKVGPMAMLGHLDLLRELPRVIRRAGARTAYSKGFNPMPEMSFGPALSLGVASLDEYLDVLLIDASATPEFRDALNRAVGTGLRFTEVTHLEAKQPRLNTLIQGAEYLICFSDSDPVEAQVARLAQAVTAFLDTTECRVERTTKGVTKSVNVRAFVEQLQAADGTAPEIAAAGVVGCTATLRVQVVIRNDGATKVSELVQAILGSQVPHEAIRTRLLLRDPSLLGDSRKPQQVDAVSANSPVPSHHVG